MTVASVHDVKEEGYCGWMEEERIVINFGLAIKYK